MVSEKTLDGNLVEAILDFVKKELVEADKKFVPIRSYMEAYGILDEECEEVKFELRDNNRTKANLELIQLAAMCVRTIHDVIYKASNPRLIRNEDGISSS